MTATAASHAGLGPAAHHLDHKEVDPVLPTTDVTQHAGSTLATVTGDVDAFTVTHVTSVLDQLQFGTDTVVILDLRPVTFLDSSGLGAIVDLRGRLEPAGGRLRLVCGSETLRLFQLMSLDQVIDLYPGLEEASAAGAGSNSAD